MKEGVINVKNAEGEGGKEREMGGVMQRMLKRRGRVILKEMGGD